MSLPAESIAWLTAGEVHTAAGATLEATALACLGQPPQPGIIDLPYLQSRLNLPYFDAGLASQMDDCILQVAGSALRQAGIVNAAALASTALLIGTSSGDVSLHEQGYQQGLASGLAVIPAGGAGYGKMALRIAKSLRLRGPDYTLTTACSAGANALLLAASLVRAGRVEHALVLGVETRNLVSLLGFYSLMLSAKGSYRPFDANRDGVVLGEGIAAAVVSRSPCGPLRWALRGGASFCDSSHPTASSVEGVAGVMAAALVNAGLPAAAIVAVKAHGTGTSNNDEVEALGLQQVFGTAIPPFTSLKSSFGHTLGACGVVETLAFLRALELGGLPPTHNFAEADPAFGGLSPVRQVTPVAQGPVLLNYFGFGGNNCSLVCAPC